MKKFISYIFFLPLILFLFFILINYHVLAIKESISIVWFLKTDSFPIFAVTIFFFSSYIILIWILLKFSDIFSNIEKNKLTGEVDKLKAKLQDGQQDILLTIKEDFKEIVSSLKIENEKMFKKIESEIKTIKENNK